MAEDVKVKLYIIYIILKIYKIVCLLKGLSLDFIYLLIKYSFWCTDSNKVDWQFVCAVSMM